MTFPALGVFDLCRWLRRFERDEMREKGTLARAPWPLPDPPLLKPARIVNRMMRANQMGRKTILAH